MNNFSLLYSENTEQMFGMRATWRFKAIRENLNGFYIRRSCGADSVTGTDQEALEFAKRVQDFYKEKEVLRVEARSEGPIDLNVPDSEWPRELFGLRPHPSGNGCLSDETRLGHSVWHLSFEEGISYSAFRGRGYLTEIRIFEASGQLTQIVLIDQLIHVRIPGLPYAGDLLGKNYLNPGSLKTEGAAC